MNVYRGLGDLSRMVGTIIFFLMAWKGNTSAISRKSQELYLMVSITRYLDLFYTFYSMYNALMKILYISLGAATVACLYFKEPGCSTYNAAQDSVQHWLHIVVPCIFIAVAYKSQDPRGFYPLEDTTELMWTFSVVLESVAMLPQLLMVRRSYRNDREHHGGARDAIYVPLFLFGIYRFLYVLNWAYRAMTEPFFAFLHSYIRLILTVSAFIQVLMYSEFFYIVSRPHLCPANEPPAGTESRDAGQTSAEETDAAVDAEAGGMAASGKQGAVEMVARQQDQQPATSMDKAGNEAPISRGGGSTSTANAKAHRATTDVEAGQKKVHSGAPVNTGTSMDSTRTGKESPRPPIASNNSGSADAEQQDAAPTMNTVEATAPHTTAGDVIQPLIRSRGTAPQDSDDAERGDNNGTGGGGSGSSGFLSLFGL